MRVIAASPKEPNMISGISGHHAEQHADDTKRLARFAFLLVFYSDPS